VRVLWGDRGVVGRVFDPLALWRARAQDVDGHSIPTGHFMAEEAPDLVRAFLRATLAAAPPN